MALFGILALARVILVHELAEVLVIFSGIRAARRPVGARPKAILPTAAPTRIDEGRHSRGGDREVAASGPPRLSMLNCYITKEVME
ncbi:MAG: hypothetical protein KKF42_07875 [Actinobacteria bacterium]|uniref:hypothetical protein n=1 Tax=Leucobacter sp. W1478 TaxID=3439065 RepID=UPI003F2BF3DE|nr:hypothetical protein [Actinomycetota bacterium]